MIENIRAVAGKVAAYVSDFLSEPRAFRGQQLRGGGPVAAFESLLAEQCGFPYCVATCNATSALFGLGLVLGVRGRTVWFPVSHWEGSISAMRLMGAKIRRYDQDSGRFDHSVSGRNGRVVVASASTDVAAIREHCARSNCVIVEDSSRIPEISAELDARSEADLQVLSFGPGKPLCLGEGGAILFRSRVLHDRFVACTMHPERTAAATGRAPRVPAECLNARIHPVAAILGIEALAPAGKRTWMLEAGV